MHVSGEFPVLDVFEPNALDVEPGEIEVITTSDPYPTIGWLHSLRLMPGGMMVHIEAEVADDIDRPNDKVGIFWKVTRRIDVDTSTSVVTDVEVTGILLGIAQSSELTSPSTIPPQSGTMQTDPTE